MQIVCLGLLLFRLTWAAPTLKPQPKQTKQDSVEEQGQEEHNEDNIALHHHGKKGNKEPVPQENIVQEKEKDLSLLRADKNNQSSKSQNLFENRQTMNEDYSASNKENAHDNPKMSIDPKSARNNGAEDGDDVISKLHDQEEYGAALVRNNMRHIMEPGAVTELLGKENREIKPRHVLSKIAPSTNYLKAPSKGKKSHQTALQAQTIPIKSKSIHHIQLNPDYLKQLRKIKKIPSDFEGSGYPNLQERGDNDISPFSGDGQPFKDISGKEEAIDPGLEGTDSHTEFPSPSEAETVHPETGGPGYYVPEKEKHGRGTIGSRNETAQQANTADVSLVEGSNDIIGSTDFKELPGKEGNRVDAGSQNAHQGKIEFHYPHGPSKGRRKEGGTSDVAQSTNYNEIPKNGKGSRRKDMEHSNRNQVPSNEKQRFPSKGKSRGQPIPSRGLNHETQNEIGSHSGPNNEETHIRKNHYVPQRKNNFTWSKGMPQRKGSWGYRKHHSSRRFRPPKNPDSSESHDSGSSSESDGD